MEEATAGAGRLRRHRAIPLAALVLAMACSRRPIVPATTFLGSFEGQGADGKPVTATLWRQDQALGGVLQSGDRVQTLALQTELVASGVVSGGDGTAAAEARLSGDGRLIKVRAGSVEIDLQRREAAAAAPAMQSYATRSGDLALRLWRQERLLTGSGSWLGQTAALLGQEDGGGAFAVSLVVQDGVKAEGRLRLSDQGARLEVLGRSFELQKEATLALKRGDER